MKTWKKSLLLSLGLLLSLLLVTVACGDDSDDTFKIGVMESVTGPGDTYGTLRSRPSRWLLTRSTKPAA